MAQEQEVSRFLKEKSVKKADVLVTDDSPLQPNPVRALISLTPDFYKPVNYAEFIMYEDNSVGVTVGERNVSGEFVSLGNLETLELLVEILKQKAKRDINQPNQG